MDAYGSALTGCADRLNMSLVLLDNGINRSQTDARALANFLGAEEWFENFGQDLRTESAAIVGNCQAGHGKSGQGRVPGPLLLAGGNG